MGTRRIKRFNRKLNPNPQQKPAVQFFIVKDRIKTVEDCIDLFSAFYAAITVPVESIESFKSSLLGKFYERRDLNEKSGESRTKDQRNKDM